MHNAKAALRAAALALLLLAAACGQPDPAGDLTFDLQVPSAAHEPEHATLVARQGDTVTLRITSEQPGAVHLHGYDLEQAVTPGETALIGPLQASATGRFSITLHPAGPAGSEHTHEHGEAGPAAEVSRCETTPADLTLSISLVEGRVPGTYVVEAEAGDFVIGAEGRHLHLYLNGSLYGMFAENPVVVDFPHGEHHLTARLAEGTHCELDLEAQAMVVVPVDAGPHAGTTDEMEMTEDGDTASPGAGSADELLLGTLEVHPR